MIKSIISYFVPVKIRKNEEIVVIIRGLTFRSNSMIGIINQIEKKIEFFRNELGIDAANVSRSITVGNIHGRWNPNIAVFKNDIQTLYALKDYLEKHTGIRY
ncbi:MAG: hypothetical protein ABRQ24_05565 [Syntrophomonadaceae bacterium]